jgi:hypothetical protein
LSYSGVHKPSVLARLAGLVWTGISLVVIWWIITTWTRAVGTFEGFVWLTVGLIVSFAIAIFIHEAGHLVAAMVFGQPARKIRIGSGSTLIGLRLRGLVIQICSNPLGGGAVYFSSLDSPKDGGRIAALLAGPAVNLLAGVYALGLIQFGVNWLGVFAVANIITFISSAVPATSVEGGREHPSDGMQLLRILFKPPTPSAYFEGAEMAADAHGVQVHALEDAQIDGANEVTDMHLLRALNRDPPVGALFATVELTRRLPVGETPQTSDEGQIPTWSATSLAVLESAFRQSRDLGVSKPNAAAICLGLLAVDCPAGRLLKEAGISEAAVRTLASTTDPQESGGPAGVISPDLPLERWGSAADRALSFAYRIARADQSPFVGTQHMVAALVAEPQSRSAGALARLGFVLVRHDEKPVSAGEEEAGASPQLSPQAATAVAGALWRTGPTYPSGTGELCVGIIDQQAGIGAELLAAAGITVAAMESALRFVPREPSEPAGCTAASWPMWQLRASARMGKGRWVEARDDFLVAERATTTDAHRAMCRNNAAWASLMSGEPALRAQALELAGAAHAFKADNLAFSGTYAFALMENGSPAEAAALLEPVAATHPRPRDRASDLCLLAICQARLNQTEAAATNLKAAGEADPRCALLERAQAELDRAAAASIC